METVNYGKTMKYVGHVKDGKPLGFTLKMLAR